MAGKPRRVKVKVRIQGTKPAPSPTSPMKQGGQPSAGTTPAGGGNSMDQIQVAQPNSNGSKSFTSTRWTY